MLELKKRLKVVQGKFDKQKEQIRVLEENLRVQPKSHDIPGSLVEAREAKVGAGLKPIESSTSTDKASLINSKVHKNTIVLFYYVRIYVHITLIASRVFKPSK